MTDALEQSLAELIGYIKELCPGARLRITGNRFEDEDANIDIYPPLDWTLDQLDELEEKIGDRKLDILIERGHFIHTFVYEPEQQIEEAFRQKADAERVLAEAGTRYQTGE
ncbi:MAG: hypothetical protein P8186_05165 [Anaerolineae bacterium]|jgi:hypothetical protein